MRSLLLLALVMSCAPALPVKTNPTEGRARSATPPSCEVPAMKAEPPVADSRFWLRSRPVLGLAPGEQSLAFGPSAELALEVREDRRIVWSVVDRAPVSWFGEEEDPVFAAPRVIVTRREARLFAGQGELKAVLAGRDAIEVRTSAGCGVIALRFGGPEYSLRTFSSVTGEPIADFPWIPARFEPDFDYQPACDGRKILVFSRPSPPLPRGDPNLADRVLFLGAESVVLGLWVAPKDEEVLSACFSSRSSGEALIVSRRFGKVLSSRVGPSGRRAVLGSSHDATPAGCELDGAPPTLLAEKHVELADRLAGARGLPIARVEQVGLNRLVAYGQDGRSAELSSVLSRARASEVSGENDLVRYRWDASEEDPTEPGRAPLFAGPDGSWVLLHPGSHRQLAIWLVELEDPEERNDKKFVGALLAAPSGAFYADAALVTLVYYPSGHELKDPEKAGKERCAAQFRPEILSAFLGHTSEGRDRPSAGSPDGMPGEHADPCSSGPRVGKMLGDDE